MKTTISIFLILGTICSCSIQEKEACLKYVEEIYKEQIDTALVKEGYKGHEFILEVFNESSIKGSYYEAYHLQFYSTFDYGKSVTFEKNSSGYSLSVKCITKEELFKDCKNYHITIEEKEWDEFEKMIYEFNFWTAEDFRANMALDGVVFYLEGNRPQAKNCNKKTYKLMGRGSPRYDKMGALCNTIFEYEEHLKFRYEQMNKIK